MARARVTGPKESAGAGDSLVETYNVWFFGTDVPVPDSSPVTVTIGPTDTLTQAEDKLVDAVMAEAARLGYAMARNRVAFPKTARGS